MATGTYLIVSCLLLSTIAASPVQRPVFREKSTDLGVGDLRSCLLACSEGTAAIQAFCRTIPLPRVRAACWAVQFAGVAACDGFCYLYFG